MNKTTFKENLEDNQLIAVRSFDAPVQKVWKAWSDPDLLCQWWAPLPYICKIDEMDFKVGGYWIYNMIGPEGDIFRGRMDYLQIEEFKRIVGEDYFCDEQGEKSGDVPPMHMEAIFENLGDKTTVTNTTTYASPEALKQMAEMGAAEGWDLACNQLEQLLMEMEK